MEIQTDIIRQVYDKDGYFITVRPWPEADDCVNLSTVGEGNETNFGKIDVALSPNLAEHLGWALIDCAREVRDKHNIKEG